ncbi:hypothetical protein [Vannielia litorea]|uniref:hypothetical protein n=1 Tax=Vannielia litorea TaxID=1217970 RepID=UPI001BCA9E01|nr:hypothetical protein [Vannielia litorea]MBS8225843.1 hypothetical protein [Vannielia litorea]
MRKFTRSWATSLFLIAAGAAGATPPQAVDVIDTLFAESEGAVWVLREVRDNHGLHTVVQTDIVLVEIDKATGEERGQKPVKRVVDLGLDFEERSRLLPLEEAVNPYDVYDIHAAWPLHTPESWRGENSWLDAEGFTFIGYDDKRYQMPLEALRARVEGSLVQSRRLMPLIRIGAGTIGPDPFDPADWSLTEECRMGPVFVLEPGKSALARLDCDEEALFSRLRMWVLLPVQD